MKKLHDPKQKENVQEIMKQGQVQEFWLLILEAVDESIEHLQDERDGEEIKTLSADEYKLEAELLKAKIANLKKLKNLPQTLIQSLNSPDQSQPNFDPYYVPEDFRQRGTTGG